MPFRFLHLADLHVETVFGGRPEVRKRLLAATREALQAAVELALEQELHAVLIAGDAFDDERLSQEGADFFMGQMQRLVDANIHVFYATGNHDPGSKKEKACQLGFVDAVPSVGPGGGLHLFRRAAPKAVTILDDEGAPLATVVGAGHSQAKVESNLASKFTHPGGSVPVIGLLHTQVEAASISEDHANYAPSLRADYEAAGLDYWALGHVHKRQQVFEDLPVWYSGNLQGRNAKETGPKGGLLVSLRAEEEPEVQFVPLAPVEWHHLVLDQLQDVSDRSSLLAAFERAALTLEQRTPLASQDLCVRFIPTGACPLSALLRDPHSRLDLEEELQGNTDLLEVQIRPKDLFSSRDLSDLDRSPSVQREALGLIRAAQTDDALLMSLAPDILPGHLASEDTPENKLAYLRQRLAGLEEELLTRCFLPEAWL
ncbi:MAG: exonuclease SbcCD subunit D [Planctomycetes bacterium]|nr:exonuclease SbcCD subunit D [Planctomycetota bacterium]